MAFDAINNFCYSTVANAPGSGGITIQLESGTGGRCPAVPFNMVVWPAEAVPLPGNAEVIRVTNRVGDELTAERKQEESNARAIIKGDQIALFVTKRMIRQLQEAVEALPKVVSVATFGARVGASASVNGKAINEAITALGSSGGIVESPERGLYEFSGEVSLLKKENVLLRGQGGWSGGGASPGKAYSAGTCWQYNAESETQTSVINATLSIGCGIEKLYVYSFSKKIAEKGGVIINLEGANFFNGYEFGLEGTGTGGLAYPVNGISCKGGASGSNVHKFEFFSIRGCGYAIIGKLQQKEECVGPRFESGFFAACSSGYILNPDQEWLFGGCIFEPRRNEAGAIVRAKTVVMERGGGEKNMEASGLTFIGGWLGGVGSKAETEGGGVHIQFCGKGLYLYGTGLLCAETLVELVGKSDDVIVQSPIAWAKVGLKVPVGSKFCTNIRWEPSFRELGGVAESVVATSVEGEANIASGSTLKPKTPPAEAFPTIASPAAELAALKTAVDAIRTVLKNDGKTK